MFAECLQIDGTLLQPGFDMVAVRRCIDLIEERLKKRSESREERVGGQVLRWNYRSEIVQGLQLDRPHRNIWISFALIIMFGFAAFVKVKGDVIESRRAEMAERERLRKELHLTGEHRKTVAIVPT
ncbi:unnamed protein product [Toxocara canis]|uniref:Transmembrane protein n=1 Tax=Toxocara canis TaxID=6265 RepID=A0A183UX01_TOXCA|nr:unnamed protein product [Toxocara canis]